MSIDRGEYDAARGQLGEGLTIASEIGDRHGLVNALEGFARLAAARGDAARVLRLDAAADAIRREIGLPRSPADRAMLEGSLQPDGPVPAVAAHAEGRAMSAEEAVAYALTAGDVAAAGRPGADQEPPEKDGMAALSRREREVVALIAQGMSNRRIAEALVIAEVTAANHVKHILRKLGLRSRAQVAAWAVTRGLSGTLEAR